MGSNVLCIEMSASHCPTPTPELPTQPTNIKVGCLNINPSTTRGRKLYIMQMFLLCFIPHAAFIAQNCSIIGQLSAALETSWYLYTEVTEILTLAETIMAVQDERQEVSSHFFIDSNRSGDADINKLLQAFTSTNAHLESAPPSLLADGLRMTLYHLREDARSNTFARGRDSYKRMEVYDDIGAILLLSLESQVKTSTASIWRQLSASYELVRAREKLSRALSDLQYLTVEETDAASVRLASNLVSGVEYLAALVQYLKADHHDFEEVQLVIDYFKISFFFNDTMKMPDIKSSGLKYAKDSKTYLDKLRRFQYGFRSVIRKSAQQEVWTARRTLGVGIGVFLVMLITTPLLILMLKNTMTTMQSFSSTIATTTQRLMAEKQKSDLLLSRMLPMPVLQRLRAQKTVPAEAFDAVTIFFSDIVGFTSISANSTPMEIINMLNMLYRLFDEKIMQYNVYKVETIGDAYMAVSGLPQRNGNKHASEIADMSISLMRSLDGAMVPHCPLEALKIRAGVNTGPCVAGVVGTCMPRYCLFGDTINTASRMESTGEAMKIHISDTTKKALDEIGGYEVESRGFRDIPGKGQMETFWLIGKLAGLQHESPCGPRLQDYDQDFIEMLIS